MTMTADLHVSHSVFMIRFQVPLKSLCYISSFTFPRPYKVSTGYFIGNVSTCVHLLQYTMATMFSGNLEIKRRKIALVGKLKY